MAQPTTTEAPSPQTPSSEVDLALSILTILTSLCSASGPKRQNSKECLKAQSDLLALAEISHQPWVVRGSSDPSLKRGEFEQAMLAYITKSKIHGLINRNQLPTTGADGMNWGSFFRVLKSILSLANKIIDPAELVGKLRDHLISDPNASLEQLKVALEFHITERLSSVISSINSAEDKVLYLIIGLSLFLFVSTVCWLSLNIRTYLSQRKLRKAQKASRHAGLILRELNRRGRGGEAVEPERQLL